MARNKVGEDKKSKSEITPRMRRFILEYPKHDKVVDAVRAAGYTGKHPGKQGWTLMNDPRILHRIDMNAAARRRYRKINEGNIEEELSRMGFANVLNHFDADGNMIPPHKLPRDVAAAVKKLKMTQTQSKGGEVVTEAELELLDKKASLELLGRGRGMWDNKDGGAGIGLAYIQSLGRTVGPTGVDQEENGDGT